MAGALRPDLAPTTDADLAWAAHCRTYDAREQRTPRAQEWERNRLRSLARLRITNDCGVVSGKTSCGYRKCPTCGSNSPEVQAAYRAAVQ